MSDDFGFLDTTGVHSSNETRLPCGRISDIAKRVGVAPRRNGGVVMPGDDGNNYDVFEVVLAVLDHIDKATKRGEDTHS